MSTAIGINVVIKATPEKIYKLTPNKKVVWKCINSIEDATTDPFAGCTYDWALFMKSLESLCETGTGTPSQQIVIR